MDQIQIVYVIIFIGFADTFLAFILFEIINWTKMRLLGDLSKLRCQHLKLGVQLNVLVSLFVHAFRIFKDLGFEFVARGKLSNTFIERFWTPLTQRVKKSIKSVLHALNFGVVCLFFVLLVAEDMFFEFWGFGQFLWRLVVNEILVIRIGSMPSFVLSARLVHSLL